VIVVPADVLAAIERHAREVDERRPRFESLGVLVLDGSERVIRYTKLGNPARRPNQAFVASPRQLTRRGRPFMLVHAHPGPAMPSERDLRSARRFGWNPFGIYSLTEGRLHLWRIDGEGYAEVEFVSDGRAAPEGR
jgi:proteasome lid subunit RPN8/RPN11